MKYTMLSVGAMLAFASPAVCQWTDNFDSYANNTVLQGVGGWAGWDNATAAAGKASNAFARSAPHSIEIGAAADAVRPKLGATSGRWVLTAHQYIETNKLTNHTWLIINNRYNHGGPYSWSCQFRCNFTSKMVEDRQAAGRVTAALPIQFDRWVEWRLCIDLDANTIEAYYGGKLLSRGTYVTSTTAPKAIENIDLFSQGATCYWDDISLLSSDEGPYSYHTVANEFRRCDHQTNTQIVMTMQGTNKPTGLNCVTMDTPFSGWVGTVTAPTNIHRFTVLGTNVTFGPALNSTATAGGNICQVWPFAGHLYFSTQGGSAGGILQRIPIGGGAVETRLDIGSTTPAAKGLANGLALVGTKLYVCTFGSGAQAFGDNQIIEHDPLGAAGNGKVLGTMPKSKYQPNATTNYGIGSVHAQEYMIGTKAHLAVIGVFGDIVIFDVSGTTLQVVEHWFGGRKTATGSNSNLVNSFHYDPTTNSFVIGSRTDSAVERQAGNHLADQMIARPTGASTSSVGGTWFVPNLKNDDKSVAYAGKDFTDCAGPIAAAHRLTDFAMGAAVSPNANFAFAVYNGTGTDNAFLAFGPRIPAVNLLGCNLHVNPVAIIGITLTAGRGSVKVAIPSGVTASNIFRQWASGGVGPFTLSQVVQTNIK